MGRGRGPRVSFRLSIAMTVEGGLFADFTGEISDLRCVSRQLMRCDVKELSCMAPEGQDTSWKVISELDQ